jgi:4-hydroxy-3-polyprenylbenzoate decarboxylase
MPSLAAAQRLVVGISGASGVIYGVRLLEVARELGLETHLVVSKAAEMTLGYETSWKPDQVRALAHTAYAVHDVGAAIASGSFKTLGMVIAPCSIRTMSELATGVTTSLLTRAGDVMLKERRPLILMIRETPLHLGHLRTMTALSEMGAIVAPPMPALYAKPKSVEELIDQSVGRVFDLLGLSASLTKRWGEDLTQGKRRPQATPPKTPRR